MKVIVWTIIFIGLIVIILGAAQMQQAKSIRAIAIDLLERDQYLDRRIFALEQKYASDTLEFTVRGTRRHIDYISVAEAKETK